MAYMDVDRRKAWEKDYKARKAELGKARYAANRVQIRARQKAHLSAHPEKRQAWCSANRDKLKAYKKARYDKEEKRAYNRAYADVHQEQIRAQSRSYYAAHREERAFAKKAYLATPKGRAVRAKQQKVYQRVWYLTHQTEFVEKAARRRAQKRQTRVEKINFKKILRESNGLCAICHKPFDLFGVHFDHTVPLSRGGTHTTDNIQATHAYCNLAKGARVA